MKSPIHRMQKITPCLQPVSFCEDILAGLTQTNKAIASKYFYDDIGSELFNQITAHPDYYLTNCEIEIMHTYHADIGSHIDTPKFNLIELGPGEGIKTQILIERFLQSHFHFRYVPVDISSQYLAHLASALQKKYNDLYVNPIQADYLSGLKWQSDHSDRKNLVLFLGSSIGNLGPSDAQHFLQTLHAALNPGDLVLIGFDLKKDLNVLHRAYNDSHGLTKRFNLNLLARINRELDANFSIQDFTHHEYYNVHSGAMESYLISLKQQMIELKKMECTIPFQSFEPIHTEFSYKFTPEQIIALGEASGFEIVKNYHDSKNYFIDSLWQLPTNQPPT